MVDQAKKGEHSRNLNAHLRVLSRKDPKQFWKVLEMEKKQNKAQRYSSDKETGLGTLLEYTRRLV